MGRDTATIERSGSVGEDTADTATVLSKAQELTQLGITLLTIGVNGPKYDLSVVEALCHWRNQQ